MKVLLLNFLTFIFFSSFADMSVRVSFHDFYFSLFVANFCHYTARDCDFSLKFHILLRLISKRFDINLMQAIRFIQPLVLGLFICSPALSPLSPVVIL